MILTDSQAEPGKRYLEALPRKLLWKLEAEPPDLRYQAEPGNAYPEALPPISIQACEAEPLDIGSQTEPGS